MIFWLIQYQFFFVQTNYHRKLDIRLYNIHQQNQSILVTQMIGFIQHAPNTLT